MPDLDTFLYSVASFVAGLFVLEYGADKFIDHTAIVAKRLRVSPTLIGLLTCGAEWEELVVIAVALGQNKPTLALGNLMGSSVANILASFSLGLLFTRSTMFDKSSKIYAAALLGLTSIFLLLLSTLSSTWKWAAGTLLIVAFVIYVASVCSLIYKGTLVAPEDNSDSDSDSDSDDSGSDSDSDSDLDVESGKKRPRAPVPSRENDSADTQQLRLPRDSEETACSRDMELIRSTRPAKKAGKKKALLATRRARPKPMWHHMLKLGMGLGALLVSSYIIAHSAGTIGSELGLSGTVIGTTILSLATTLPEKFLAVMGGVRRQPGIMVANTVGSNIFLVTLCAGILFVWGDAEQIVHGFTMFEAMVMWCSSAAIFAMVLVGGTRWMGVVCLTLYMGFLVVEITQGRSVDMD